jgi:hypothetical protein
VPSQIGESAVHCLAYQPKTQKVIMCTRHEVGHYDVAAKSFCALARTDEITGFPSCPSAPLEQNAKGIDQLCGAFCGASHSASAPLCSSFPIPANRVCGPAAVAYNNTEPDPEKRWMVPPGLNAAPRCAGFVGQQDAGAKLPPAGSGGRDAGVEAGAAHDASTTSDGASEADAAHDAEETPVPEVDEADASPDDEDARAKKRGCSCQLWGGAAQRVDAAGLFALVLLAAGLGARRRSRTRRADR